MSAWVVWLILFTGVASVARFVTADSLTDALRDRWEVHFLAYMDFELAEADRILQVRGASKDPRKMGELRRTMHELAAAEPGVPWYWFGERRRAARPWSTRIARLERLSMYSAFPGCRWCMPFWLYLPATVITWGWVFGFSSDTRTLFVDAVEVPVLWWLPLLVLSFRWVYALVDQLVAR
jgi:hypothetical protein